MDLYLKLGGIPQFILENANDKTEQKKLDDAISTCTEDIIKYIGEGDTQEDTSHKLVHIVTNLPKDRTEYPSYSEKLIKFASHYVGEKGTSKLEKTLRYRLISEMNVALKFGKSNQVFGNLFEEVAHRLLRNGGVFKVRSLDTKAEEIYRINPQDRKYMFFDVNEIENGKYYQPYEVNFPSIDAIIAPSSLFQMTTSLSHNTNVAGLEKLGSKLSINRINLYYVVPTVLFNRFQKQDFVGDIQEQYKWKYRINQYVLGIDISSIGPKPDPGSDFNVIRSRNVSEADGSIRKPDSTWKNDDRKCYNCGKKGHIARYCKSRKQ
ncbi:hypothetical protein RhiirA1_540851 [Rhizophagus irregularis]|uniref:CCHC-type domain-containing protein n=1 Tax=Rhizophagus irregularis TaxID=588596 RepID=A0A2N0R684_9GLOM|nr:hypothetical protein RhiirA1_540851 [Rhizophagus irregularis]CAB4462935.1 unnamed protein product [Rhizophagus irregularis]